MVPFERRSLTGCFSESWDDPLPWRDERHAQISVATDASASGWGATVISPFPQEMSDYWSGEELSWDIATKEAMAIHNSSVVVMPR